MKLLRRIFIPLILLAITVIFLYYQTPSGQVVTIDIYYTNDIHGQIFARKNKKYGPTGGMAALKSFLNLATTPYLLLDAGDIFQGTPEGDLTGGAALIDLMNLVGYDAAEVGNHDLDQGIKNLASICQRAKFPLLGANLVSEKNQQLLPFLSPWTIKEIKGIKIGIIGLITSRLKEVVLPSAIRGLSARRELDYAQKYIKELQPKVDLIILLTHVGIERNRQPTTEDDKFLADNLPEVAAIIGGHSHTYLKNGWRSGRTGVLVCQTGAQLQTVGKLTLYLDKKTKKLVKSRTRVYWLNVNEYAEDEIIKARAAYYKKLVGGQLDRVIGSAAIELRRKSDGESLLGNWQTDLMRKFTGAEVAFQNSGGIREDLRAGEITYRDIYQVSPFNNTVVLIKLSGRQIKEVLEQSVSGSAGFLQVSGLKFSYDVRRTVGERVTEIVVGNKPLDYNRTYLVATNNFLAEGGDNYPQFKNASAKKDTGILLRDIEIEEIRRHSPIKARLEGRIKKLDTRD